jgi:hypothetical protein
VLIGASLASTASGDASPVARAARLFRRCGTFRDQESPYGSSPNDEYGVYILSGWVACRSAISIQRAVFAGEGEGLEGVASAYTFYRGWYCDGQMGGYTCQNALRRPSRRFAALACEVPDIGCPTTDAHLGP